MVRAVKVSTVLNILYMYNVIEYLIVEWIIKQLVPVKLLKLCHNNIVHVCLFPTCFNPT
jgi:hypothetical protein